jgi:hypothetical protein
MPAGDPLVDVDRGRAGIGALVRRAEAGQAAALEAIFDILWDLGRHNWQDTLAEVLPRFGLATDTWELRLEDGPLVARIARAFHLREELAIAYAFQALLTKERNSPK